MSGRLLLDVSSLARWTGPPVGITRVEHALSCAARDRPGTVLCVWDRAQGRFRVLQPGWAEIVTGWSGAIDMPAPRRGWMPSRQPLFGALERVRLTTGRPALAALTSFAQDALLAPRRHGHRLRDTGGRRIAHVPPALALGDDIAPGPGDVLFSAGSPWFHLQAAELGRLKQRLGFRYAALCYDLIPITHPQFFLPADATMVRDHWRAVLPVTDLVITNASCIARDVAEFCADQHLRPPRIAVRPLGHDPIRTRPAPPPPPLAPGRYVLFVSTIEPRKGHAMLLRVWRRLLERGIPQRHGFHLVFVGRFGWMADDVLRDIAGGAGLHGSVLHLSGLDDADLNSVQAHAAFAVYPSCYEGFGLPVIEAFAHGRPVLASTGGALPETVAGACPCLPPEDDAAWEAMLAAWIERPEILAGFRAPSHPGWAEAAAALLDCAATA